MLICKRPGHLARDCNERQAQTLERESENGDLNYDLCCLECGPGWSKPRKTFRPQRQPITLADFITPNTFRKAVVEQEIADDQKSDWEPGSQEQDPRQEAPILESKYINADMLEVLWPEDGEDELHATSAEEPEFIEVELTWDSAAGDSVMDEEDAPGHKVEESPGSRSGACFVSASNGRMFNKGRSRSR